MKTLRILLTLFLLLGSITAKTQSTNGGFIRVMQLDDDARNIIRTIENERVAGGGSAFTLAERTYVNYIVTNFKAIGVWSKITALYGFVGGTAASHKWNWKDMRNLDAAYRLVFFGGLTHNSNGITPNGTTGYADTFLIPSTTLPTNNVHLSYYTNQNITLSTSEYVMGVNNGNNQNLGLSIRRSTNTSLFIASGFATSPNNRADATVTDSRGMSIATLSTNAKIFLRGNLISSNTASGFNTIPTSSIWLFSANPMGTSNIYWTSKPSQFASIGSGLTDTEAIRMSNIVTFAQSILNRQ